MDSPFAIKRDFRKSARNFLRFPDFVLSNRPMPLENDRYFDKMLKKYADFGDNIANACVHLRCRFFK